MYRIYVRDQFLNRVAEVTDYQSLELIPRFNNVGSFVLTLPTDTLASKELIKRKSGVIVVRNGVTLFSGPVTSKHRKWDANGDVLTVAGSDDMVFLQRHLAYPVTDGAFSLKDYDVKTGAAETIMKSYIQDNIGWRPDRAIALSMAPDKGLGKVITGRARFHPLLELEQSLAMSGGGLGFNILQKNNEYEFDVYQPTDKTKSAIFSPLLGNLSSFEYNTEAPEANHIIVAGQGEGSLRTIIERSDMVSGLEHGRIETFVDRRDTDELTELQQELESQMVEKAEKNTLSITPIDTPSLSFGKDYGLGDKVSIVLTQPNELVTIETLQYFLSAYQTTTVENEKVRKIQEKFEVIQDVVREVKITITTDGESISPVVGNKEDNAFLGLFGKMRKMGRRISNLERV